MTSAPNQKDLATPEECAIAGLLDIARQSRSPVPPVGERLGADAPTGNVARDKLASAYRVQSLNVVKAVERGEEIIGRKIGLTSKTVQAQLGVDQPDFGVLFGSMQYSDGQTIPADTLIQPRIEAEIAFVLSKDITQPDVTLEEVADAIEYVVLAAEIVDSAIQDWRISLADTIADNASCGAFVLGENKLSLDEVDLRLCGMVMSRNGQEVSFGVGAACLGHPLNAVKWLADISTDLGSPLRAGEVILSGALGPMVDAKSRDIFKIEVAGLGTLTVPFA